MKAINRLIVDLSAIRTNLQRIRERVGNRRVFAVLKANAYGLGAVELARAIQGESDGICLATPGECRELREAHVPDPILCLGYWPAEDIEEGIRLNVMPTIYTLRQAGLWNEAAKRLNVRHPIHIKLDTGHSRLGFRTDDGETLGILKQISEMDHLRIEGTYSHFSTSDEEDPMFARLQLSRFLEMTDRMRRHGIDPGIRHIANDGGFLLHSPEALCDGVRTGIGLFGYYPSPYAETASELVLKPSMRWISEVSYVHEVPAGGWVSYGRTWTAEKDTRLATISVGYADGYRRALSNKADVLIAGKRCPIRGNVCMDQLIVEIPDELEVRPGDPAVLIGDSGSERITPDELAELGGTIGYEVMTAISPRVMRIYEG